jgi:hypothetical protein
MGCNINSLLLLLLLLLRCCRLWQTREVLHQCLINPQLSVRQALLETDSYLDVQVTTGRAKRYAVQNVTLVWHLCEICACSLLLDTNSYLDVQVTTGWLVGAVAVCAGVPCTGHNSSVELALAWIVCIHCRGKLLLDTDSYLDVQVCSRMQYKMLHWSCICVRVVHALPTHCMAGHRQLFRRAGAHRLDDAVCVCVVVFH